MALAKNSIVVQFPVPTGAWGNIQYGAFSRLVGGNRVWLGRSALTTERRPTSGSDAEFAAGAFKFNIPNGELTSAGARLGLQGTMGSAFEVSLHIGNPGDNGANEVSGNNYAKVTVQTSSMTLSG